MPATSFRLSLVRRFDLRAGIARGQGPVTESEPFLHAGSLQPDCAGNR
jgi:hypothetical protein